MLIGRSAKLYQERRQPDVRNTRRVPGPRFNMSDNAANIIPLEAPLPLGALLHDINGDPPPDAGLTKPWPHGAADAI